MPNDEPHKQSTKQQDEAAFAEFVAARTMALSRSAFLLTGDHHLAEDLVQTALFQTARSWHRIRGNPEAYARRILYNENISWWRRRRHLPESPLHGSPESLSVDADADLRMTLEKALSELTAKQRTVLVLRYFEDLTEVQTAHELGIRVGTVKSMTRQSLGRLRALAPELAELIGDGDPV